MGFFKDICSAFKTGWEEARNAALKAEKKKAGQKNVPKKKVSVRRCFLSTEIMLPKKVLTLLGDRVQYVTCCVDMSCLVDPRYHSIEITRIVLSPIDTEVFLGCCSGGNICSVDTDEEWWADRKTERICNKILPTLAAEIALSDEDARCAILNEFCKKYHQQTITPREARLPTEKQLNYLKVLGYTGPPPANLEEASKLIDQHIVVRDNK